MQRGCAVIAGRLRGDKGRCGGDVGEMRMRRYCRTPAGPRPPLAAPRAPSLAPSPPPPSVPSCPRRSQRAPPNTGPDCPSLFLSSSIAVLPVRLPVYRSVTVQLSFYRGANCPSFYRQCGAACGSASRIATTRSTSPRAAAACSSPPPPRCSDGTTYSRELPGRLADSAGAAAALRRVVLTLKATRKRAESMTPCWPAV